jgi:hypothetical protein
MRAKTLSLITATIAGCGGGPGATSFVGPTMPMPTTVPGDTSEAGEVGEAGELGTSTSTSTSSEAGAASSSSSEAGPRVDMGTPPDVGSGKPAGCQGKIDFLFVISSDTTMAPFQARLLEAFAGFMATIEAELPEFDVQVMAVDSSIQWYMPDCALCQDDCDPNEFPPLCGATLTACDKKHGAGITFPQGVGATNRRCELAGGRRYITREEPDLAAAFDCVATVGLSGGGGTGGTMAKALDPKFYVADGCNEGFLRDDALLVVTLIEEDYDDESGGYVSQWIETLQAAKRGDDDAFMVLVLSTDLDAGKEHLCEGSWNPSENRLRQLANGVKHGFIESVCLDSYVPFFEEKVEHLVSLCETFEVPG